MKEILEFTEIGLWVMLAVVAIAAGLVIRKVIKDKNNRWP